MGLLTLVLVALTIGTQNQPVQGQSYKEGKGTFYYKGLMQRVAHTRGLSDGWANGFATYPDCSRIGQYILVSVRDPRTGAWSGWEWKRIVDCSQPRDYARHVRQGLVELSYEDAVRFGYKRQGTTRIRYFPPRK